MRVAIAGGTGLLGSALVARLRARGDEVTVLTRCEPTEPNQIQWDVRRGIPQPRRLEGLDAVVNLVGEPLATRPWTPARRRLLLASRVEATAALGGSLARLDRPPPVFVGVGPLGIYGDRGDAVLLEGEPSGQGFLAELGVAWEAAHEAAAKALGAKLSVLRMGVVLAAEGGAFPLLVGPFRHGFGGWLGRGEAYTPWISLADASRALLWLVDHASEGVYHGSVPDPVRHRAFCEALGEAVGRPVRGHAPAWVVRGALGELADALFLASVRAHPGRLLAEGFTFEDPEVGPLFARIFAQHEAGLGR